MVMGLKNYSFSGHLQKVSMKLVEGQDHELISQSFQNYLQSLAPNQVTLSILAGCSNAVTKIPTTNVYLAAKELWSKIFFNKSVKYFVLVVGIPLSFIKDVYI